MIDTKKIIESEVQQHFHNNLELYMEVKKHKDETKLWLWFLRIFSVTVLAGSIWGVVNLKSYTDSVIASRVQLLDNLPIAISYAEMEDWTRSIALMDDIWKDVVDNDKIENIEFKNQFLMNYLWILATAYTLDERFMDDLSKRWEKLNENPDFIKLKTKNERDEYLILNITLGELKYDFQKSHMKKYISDLELLKIMASHEGNSFYEAELSYLLGMLYLISGDKVNSIVNFKNSSELNPSEYLLSDFIQYKASYFNYTGYTLFKSIAERYDINDLEELHESTIKSIVEAGNTQQTTYE